MADSRWQIADGKKLSSILYLLSPIPSVCGVKRSLDYYVNAKAREV